jgi:hypothetical protein
MSFTVFVEIGLEGISEIFETGVWIEHVLFLVVRFLIGSPRYFEGCATGPLLTFRSLVIDSSPNAARSGGVYPKSPPEPLSFRLSTVDSAASIATIGNSGHRRVRDFGQILELFHDRSYGLAGRPQLPVGFWSSSPACGECVMTGP